VRISNRLLDGVIGLVAVAREFDAPLPYDDRGNALG
jgi:hypothetical protein